MKIKKNMLKSMKKHDKINKLFYLAKGYVEFFNRSGKSVERFCFRMQIYQDTVKEEKINTCEKMKTMELKEMNVHLFDAANYLIQLYYKTGKQYSCTITKLGKLLSIAAFIFAKNGKKLFEDDIVIYGCGTGITSIGFRYIQKIVNPENEENVDDLKTKMISESEIDESAVYPAIYEYLSGNLPADAVHVLKDIFLRFGARPARTLGELIDVFKTEISDSAAPIIDLNKVQPYFSNSNAPSEPKELYDYIKNY